MIFAHSNLNKEEKLFKTNYLMLWKVSSECMQSTWISFVTCPSFASAGESTKRYDALLAKLRDLLNDLQAALANSQGLQEQLDMTLRWLDEAERNVHKMEKGTIIVAQKEPLQENMKDQMVRIACI